MTPQQAVERLINLGWSEARIAVEIGTSQPTIHRIKRGSQPRGASFNTCTALIALADREGQNVAESVSDQKDPQIEAAA